MKSKLIEALLGFCQGSGRIYLSCIFYNVSLMRIPTSEEGEHVYSVTEL